MHVFIAFKKRLVPCQQFMTWWFSLWICPVKSRTVKMIRICIPFTFSLCFHCFTYLYLWFSPRNSVKCRTYTTGYFLRLRFPAKNRYSFYQCRCRDLEIMKIMLLHTTLCRIHSIQHIWMKVGTETKLVPSFLDATSWLCSVSLHRKVKFK